MRGGDGTSTQPQGTARVQSRKAPTYVPVRDKLRSQPGRKDHQVYRNSKGSYQPKARKTGPTPLCVYRWMLQELLHWQPVRHVNRVLEVRGGDGTSTQPQSTANAQGRKAQTYDPVRDKVRSQPGRKTTKRTTIARGHSNRKRRRQGYRHTKSTAGCIRIRLSGLQGSANDRILEERGGGQKVNPVTRRVKCPRNSPYGKYEVGTRRSPGN